MATAATGSCCFTSSASANTALCETNPYPYLFMVTAMLDTQRIDPDVINRPLADNQTMKLTVIFWILDRHFNDIELKINRQSITMTRT